MAREEKSGALMALVRIQLKCGCRETTSYPDHRKWVELSEIERKVIMRGVVESHRCPKPKKPAPATSTVPQKP